MADSLRVVFLGTAEFAVPTLHALAAGPHELRAVFTRPDRPAGRGRRLRASPVKRAAEALELPVHQPARVSAPAGLEAVQALEPDVVFVAAFGEILSPELLAAPRLGPVNLHASLLPRYRGAAPIQRALLAGERETGVTLQWMAPELDAGDIILQRATPIGPEEGFGSLHDRLAALGAQAAAEALDLIARGEAPRLPQARERASYAPPIRREELLLDWRRPAAELARVVRAFSPRPGARTGRQGRLLKVIEARALAPAAKRGGVPGQVTEVTGGGFVVQTGEDGLLVLRVQPEAGKAMSAADYLKGHRLKLGEVLDLERRAGPPASSGRRPREGTR